MVLGPVHPERRLAQKANCVTLRAATVKQLKGLPARARHQRRVRRTACEGEAYAHKLIEAGVRVTAVHFHGTIHDFVLLNAITTRPRGVRQSRWHAIGCAISSTISKAGSGLTRGKHSLAARIASGPRVRDEAMHELLKVLDTALAREHQLAVLDDA